MRVEKVALSELSELEPLVKSTIQEIEEGMEVLDNQISIGDSGRPDVLAIDGNKALTILELKSKTADVEAIAQIIGYYEWFISNIALFAKPFPKINTDEAIRLIIIAPRFSHELLRISKYLNLDISLVKYTSIKNLENQDIGIIYENIDVSPEEGPGVSFRSVEDIARYFSDENLAKEFQRIRSDLESLGIEIVPYQGGKNYWLECRYNSEDIAFFQPRKRYLNCQIYDEQNEKYIWPPIRVTTYDEWEKQFREYFMGFTDEEE